MLRRAELAKAADGAVAALVALLKRPAVDTLNGPLRIVAVQARLVAQCPILAAYTAAGYFEQ